jgi:hypothetical protein
MAPNKYSEQFWDYFSTQSGSNKFMNTRLYGTNGATLYPILTDASGNLLVTGAMSCSIIGHPTMSCSIMGSVATDLDHIHLAIENLDSKVTACNTGAVTVAGGALSCSIINTSMSCAVINLAQDANNYLYTQPILPGTGASNLPLSMYFMSSFLMDITKNGKTKYFSYDASNNLTGISAWL